jgi:hypothetical protein
MTILFSLIRAIHQHHLVGVGMLFLTLLLPSIFAVVLSTAMSRLLLLGIKDRNRVAKIGSFTNMSQP